MQHRSFDCGSLLRRAVMLRKKETAVRSTSPSLRMTEFLCVSLNGILECSVCDGDLLHVLDIGTYAIYK
jgi:hypothetical protein